MDRMSMTLLEEATVSRKTPNDGRLEISAATAARLDRIGERFVLDLAGAHDTAVRESMPCTCARAEGATHVHEFLTSTLLRRLEPGTAVRIELDEPRRLVRVQSV